MNLTPADKHLILVALRYMQHMKHPADIGHLDIDELCERIDATGECPHEWHSYAGALYCANCGAVREAA